MGFWHITFGPTYPGHGLIANNYQALSNCTHIPNKILPHSQVLPRFYVAEKLKRSLGMRLLANSIIPWNQSWASDMSQMKSGFLGFLLCLIVACCFTGRMPVRSVPAQLLGHMSTDSSTINYTERYDSANLNRESVGANELTEKPRNRYSVAMRINCAWSLGTSFCSWICSISYMSSTSYSSIMLI